MGMPLRSTVLVSLRTCACGGGSCLCPCLPFNAHTVESLFASFFSLGLPGRRHKQSECRTELHKHTNTQTFKTFNNGSLGSRIDEERSELRYVMRIAASVKHRIFERTLRPLAFQGACLSERRFPSQRELVVGGTRLANRRVSLKVWAGRAALALAHCGDTHTLGPEALLLARAARCRS